MGFICCASFEGRCRVIPDTIELGKITHAWIGFNREFESLSQCNLQALRNRYMGCGTVMKLGATDPLVTADCFAGSLGELCNRPSARIVVDITSFTRESLLILVKFIYGTID